MNLHDGTANGSALAAPPGRRLSDRLAEALAAEIRRGRLGTGAKLPTEAALAEQYAVSRTVVREAVARLKSLGLVQPRQGSGVYVCEPGIAPLSFDADYSGSREAVLQMVEVRRALETEVAALAAQRRTQADMRRIEQAMRAIDRAVRGGGDGVAEDVGFHRSIADAARNPFLLSTLQYLSRFLVGATRVTRANEARRRDFMLEVQDEHRLIVEAIAVRDPIAARLSASGHMNNAIRRIEQADPAFWRQHGAALARALTRGAAAS